MNSTTDFERLWRSAGIQAVVFLVIGGILYGSPPEIGASGEDLTSFYDGDRTRILIAAIILCFGSLNLMWFGAALRSALHDAGQGGWGAAATAASTAAAAIIFLLVAIGAAATYSVNAGNDSFVSGLNDLSWAGGVVLSFPLAMFVMSGAFGLWRAGIIPSNFFLVGVAALILVLLGGTTWATDGFWAADGAYSQAIAPAIAGIWILVISGLLVRRPARAAAPQPAAATAP